MKADGSVLPKQDFLEGRNALGIQKAPKRVSEIFPPAIHPREPPVYRLPLLFQQRLRTSHACTGSTVRHSASERNNELGCCCAEAVEERDSLWKGKEKPEEKDAARKFPNNGHSCRREETGSHTVGARLSRHFGTENLLAN